MPDLKKVMEALAGCWCVEPPGRASVNNWTTRGYYGNWHCALCHTDVSIRGPMQPGWDLLLKAHREVCHD